MQEMDPEYDLKTWNISLKNMALFKVIMDIVEISRLNPSEISIGSLHHQRGYENAISTEQLIFESRAIERAKNLQLPKSLITDIIHLIRPIMREMMAWYKVNGDSVRPILTPQGTVDVQKSARAMFEFSDLPVKTLFQVACRYTMEDEIFDYGKQLTQDEKKVIHADRGRLPYFWLFKVYKKEFNEKKTLNCLNAKQCVDGINCAYFENSFYTLERFIDNGSKETYRLMEDLYLASLLCYNIMSPVLLWKIKKIDRHERFGEFSYSLLKSLLYWPYQRLFAKAAKTLVTSLSERSYISLLIIIANKGETGYKDYDYGGLCKFFWNLGNQNRPTVQIEVVGAHCLLYSMVKMRDKDITFMVFDYLFKSCKDLILNEFDNMCACLIVLKEYEVLRVLWDISATRDTRVFLKFKNFYRHQHNRISPSIGSLSYWFMIDCKKQYGQYLSVAEWNPMIEEFKSIASGWKTS